MELISGAIVLFIGILLGGLAGKFFFSKKQPVSETQFRDLERARIELATKLDSLSEQRDALNQQKQKLELRLIELEKANSAFESDKKNLEERIKSNKEELSVLQAQLTGQFENLATKVLDANATKFRETSEKNISGLLSPLKDRLQEFQKKVEETYSNESRERFALKSEITRIVEANQKMTFETSNLSKALRGDVKAQGNWGEIVLKRILEASGLREGMEYVEQGKELGLKDESGRQQQPDIIVNLPEGKHLIVDSKVSLTHYDRFVTEQDEDKKKEELKGFIDSIYSHVAGLAGKRYQDQEKLITPDFVMMFFPIEGAFSLALQNDAEIFNHAWDKQIVIVSPTTLLATLRTVASVWKQERQQKNTLEIAKQGGLLYDKFVGFVESLEVIGNRIKSSQEAYEDAFDKLKAGKGNLLSRVENLRKLGVKASKRLPESVKSTDSETVLEIAEELSDPSAH